MNRRLLHELGAACIGLAVVGLLGAGFARGWGNLPWVWILAVAAVGFLLQGTADFLDARAAKERLDAIDAFEKLHRD